MNDKRTLVVVLIAVVAAFGFGVAWYLGLVKPVALMPAPVSEAPANPIVAVPFSSLPDGFPAGVPLEKGAITVSNFTASAANGEKQATRSFRSVKTVDANFTAYLSYVSDSKNGWTLVSKVDNPAAPDNKAIFAKDNKRGILSINIGLVSPPPFSISLVDISYTASPIPGMSAQ